MLVLTTVSDMERICAIVDLKTGDVRSVPVEPRFIDRSVVGHFPCRPFGITWNETELFIANNKQLLVFNASLRYQRTETVSLQVNTHQLAYHADRVWAVSPWTNSLIGLSPNATLDPLEFDLFDQIMKPYLFRQAFERDDMQHVNSLLWTQDRLFVAAHNHGRPSFIIQYNTDSMRAEFIEFNAGVNIHGLAMRNGELFWISTKTREIRSNRGRRVYLQRDGYARGFALTQDYFIVAISETLSRDKRCGGDSWIQLLDDAGHLLCEHHLRATGGINDLRLLDEYDFAHGVAPYIVASAERLEPIVD